MLYYTMSGEAITRLAREWYYQENKSYEKSEKLLSFYMMRMKLDIKELKESIRDIMLGKLMLKGSADKDGIYIDKDDFDIFSYVDRLQDELKKEKEMRIKCQENLSKMHYDIDNDILRYNPIYESKLLKESFIKAKKTSNNYGWLSPTGKFIVVEWNKHQEWALNYIESNKKLLNEYMLSNLANSQAAGDFLIEIKGWVLLHSPAQGVAKPQYSEIKKLNNRQKVFLNNYYIERGESDLAIMYRY